MHEKLQNLHDSHSAGPIAVRRVLDEIIGKLDTPTDVEEIKGDAEQVLNENSPILEVGKK